MNRRTFIKAIASIPVVGLLAKPEKSVSREIKRNTPEELFFAKIYHLARSAPEGKILGVNKAGMDLLKADCIAKSVIHCEGDFRGRDLWFNGVPVFQILLNCDPSIPNVCITDPPKRICNIQTSVDDKFDENTLLDMLKSGAFHG
jgi:hypothetical protein